MKVAIIGAGVAGLSAGCYLRMSGFETEIFERNPTAGGTCTSWRRGDYTFDSGLQWLLGSNESCEFYRLWSELIDMDSIRFVHHDVRMEIEVEKHSDPFGGKVFHLYTDLDRLRNYLLAIAPEDARPIRRFIRTARRIQSFEFPPGIRSVPDLLPWYRKMFYIKHLPLLLFLHAIKRQTNRRFARKLGNPFLREAFELLYDGDELPLMITTIPLAFNDLNGSGYPVGGSAAFVGHLERKYHELGGAIRYGAAVREVATADDRATGVVLETDEQVPADATVSAADWRFTVFAALGGRYVDDTIRQLAAQELLPVYYSVVMVSLGIARSFAGQPHFRRFPLDHPLVSPDGTRYERMEVRILNYDPTLAPAGKTVVAVSFYTRKGDWWIDLRETDRAGYDGLKRAFASAVIDAVDARLGGLRGDLEEVDVATPATYHRYTNNWQGSAQGWLSGRDLVQRSPVAPALPGLAGFYLAGHWTTPGGGLPIAIKSARSAAQYICRDQGVPFVAGSQDAS